MRGGGSILTLVEPASDWRSVLIFGLLIGLAFLAELVYSCGEIVPYLASNRAHQYIATLSSAQNKSRLILILIY